jgi:microcystin-dependent protein
MAEPFTGQISIFAFNFAPLNWAMCQGQIVPIAQNTALFSLLGTTYGGNGTTTFALPNMQGNVAVGQGQLAGGSLYDLGESGGVTQAGLSRDQAPTHNHNFMATISVADQNSAAGNALARVQISAQPKNTVGNIYNQNTLDTAMNAPISPVGNGYTHDNTQPYLVLNYCICLRGVLPTRP